MAKKRSSSSNESRAKKSRQESPERKYDVQTRVPQRTFDDLAGLVDIKASLMEEVIGPFVCKKKISEVIGLVAPKAILFTGIPGTGKTALADAIVGEINKRLVKKVKFFQESGQSMTKWFGESEANLRELFKKAHKEGPSVIFLDEVEGIAKKRDNNSGPISVLTTLLVELNNVTRGQVLVIAATNCTNLVDPAFIRSGRFDCKFEIPTPDRASRRLIFEHYISKEDFGFGATGHVLDRLAHDTVNWTGSDIESFVKKIKLKILRRLFPDISYLNMTQREVEDKIAAIEDLDYKRDVQPVFTTFRASGPQLN